MASGRTAMAISNFCYGKVLVPLKPQLPRVLGYILTNFGMIVAGILGKNELRLN